MGDKSVVERSIYGSAPPVSYKKGGRIKKTRIIRVHAGEVVLPKKEVRRLDKLIHGKTRKRGKKK
jgi:hypothetical protein